MDVITYTGNFINFIKPIGQQVNLVGPQGESSTYKTQLYFYGLAINNENEVE